MPTTLPPTLTAAEFALYVAATSQVRQQLAELVLASAFGFAQSYTRRRLSPTPIADADDPVPVVLRGQYRRLLRVPDAREVVSVHVDGVALQASQWRLLYRDRDPDGSPAPRLELDVPGARVELVGRFGFAQLPDMVRDPIYLLAARAYREKDAVFGDTVVNMETGTQVEYWRLMPPRAKLMFAQLRLPRVGVA